MVTKHVLIIYCLIIILVSFRCEKPKALSPKKDSNVNSEHNGSITNTQISSSNLQSKPEHVDKQDILNKSKATQEEGKKECPVCTGSGYIYKYTTCPECNGKRKLGGIVCQFCKGTGWRSSIGKGNKCVHCEGDGRVNDHLCLECQGNGKIKIESECVMCDGKGYIENGTTRIEPSFSFPELQSKPEDKTSGKYYYIADLKCEQCENVFSTKIYAGQKFPLKCPKCGKAAAYRAIKCTDCGFVFTLKPPTPSNSGRPPMMDMPKCPKCGSLKLGPVTSH